MLHIITPLYRFDLLGDVYNSIPKHSDITWHVSKSKDREDLTYDFIKNDKRIKIYNVDCTDTEPFKKRQHVLEKINLGYFCFLDDDTIFHPNMYTKYQQCMENNFIGMIVGQQYGHGDKLRLVASPPIMCRIDTGNVIAHAICLTKCKWPSTHIKGVNEKDFLFWDSVYKFFGNKCGLWNSPISYYNILNTEKKLTKVFDKKYSRYTLR